RRGRGTAALAARSSRASGDRTSRTAGSDAATPGTPAPTTLRRRGRAASRAPPGRRRRPGAASRSVPPAPPPAPDLRLKNPAEQSVRDLIATADSARGTTSAAVQPHLDEALLAAERALAAAAEDTQTQRKAATQAGWSTAELARMGLAKPRLRGGKRRKATQ